MLIEGIFPLLEYFVPQVLSTHFVATVSLAYSLERFYNSVTYYDFCTFIWQVYNLEATSLKILL